MAQQVISVDPNQPPVPPIDRRPRRQFAQQVTNIVCIGNATKKGVDEIATIHDWASFETQRKLADMSLRTQVAEMSGCLAPEEQQSLEDLKKEMCGKIEQITADGSSKIIEVIKNLPTATRNGLLDDLADYFGL